MGNMLHKTTVYKHGKKKNQKPKPERAFKHVCAIGINMEHV